MPALVWCPPGWCCGKLYLVADARVWHCPYSGVKAHTVVAEFDGLTWRKPENLRRFFLGQQDDLRRLVDAGEDRLKGLLERAGQAGGLEPGKRMCDLLRCVVGNPCRTVPQIPPTVLAWDGGIAVKLATSRPRERHVRPERMGVLADALEDAGCTATELLDHLRGPGPHCRGCFALDPLLDEWGGGS